MVETAVTKCVFFGRQLGILNVTSRSGTTRSKVTPVKSIYLLNVAVKQESLIKT